MVAAFKKSILDYLTYINRIPSYQGPAALLRSEKAMVAGNRTVYRWHKEFQGLLEYYPCIDFGSLGLLHAHLILYRAGMEMLSFPLAIESCWLMNESCGKDLYIHCILPRSFKEDFLDSLNKLQKLNFFESFEIIFSGDGQQVSQSLGNCFDCSGRMSPGAEALTIGMSLPQEEKDCSGLLKSYPFVVPVIFENYGRRLSLVELWKIIYEGLGKNVWSYLPKERRMSVNGKAYVKKAFKMLGDWQVFRQNIIRYKPMLEHGIEIFLLININDLSSLMDCVGKFCPLAEFYSGTEDALVRLVGDSSLLYALMDFSATGKMRMFIFDKKRTWDSSRARFAYEELFNPKSGEWTFDKGKILGKMEVLKIGR